MGYEENIQCIAIVFPLKIHVHFSHSGGTVKIVIRYTIDIVGIEKGWSQVNKGGIPFEKL